MILGRKTVIIIIIVNNIAIPIHIEDQRIQWRPIQLELRNNVAVLRVAEGPPPRERHAEDELGRDRHWAGEEGEVRDGALVVGSREFL